MSIDNHNILHPFPVNLDEEMVITWVESIIPCGFPSPALNDMDEKINLMKLLIKNPSSTFFMRVEGNSMINAGIVDGDIAVIDRSLPAEDKKIVAAYINGDFTLKRLKIDKKTQIVWLMPENDNFEPIEVKPENESFLVWGRLINVIKSY